jgi:flavin reductase (DIM6/NTAB) family NADH-FMN oxidoreductase RutF
MSTLTPLLPAPPARHQVVDPAILYWGTPVVLLSTLNDDGTPNLAPISSVFWLGHTAVLGIGLASHSLANLQRTGEVTLCLPGADLVDAVDRLALTTGATRLSPFKERAGYRHHKDKFGLAGLTPVPGERHAPPLVAECPVAMECTVSAVHRTDFATVTAEVDRVHVHDGIRDREHEHRIDPDRWRPLVMSFQRFYGLGDEVHPSRLAGIDEELYR